MVDLVLQDQSIPIVQEEAFVGKRLVDTEHVRVRTTTAEEQVVVRDSVISDRIDIKRVTVDREVDRAPDVREVDGVTIIPVLEERLVVEKRLFVVEEIHITRSRQAESVALPTTLRRTDVAIEREDLAHSKENFHGRT